MGMRGPPSAARANSSNSSSNKRIDRVKEIMERHLQGMKKGVSESDVAEWAKEMDESRRDIRAADPDLVRLEVEQVRKAMKKYNVPALGNLATEKPEGYKRFMLTQLNSMSTKLRREVKVEQSTRLLNRYDVDMQAVLEPGINWAKFKPSETLASFFDAEVELRSVTGHNKHENPPTKHQMGGTGIIAVNEINEYCKKSGTDFRGLGRWSWFVLEGSPEHRTRVLSVYHVGKAKPQGPKRYYQQHLRYIQNKGLQTNPYDMFCDDLLRQLKVWKKEGDRILLMMDANEHVLDGPFTRQLREELDLEEISHKAWRGSPPNTHISGSKPIDGVWASRSLEIGGFKILSFSESVGDHRTMIFDVSTRSLIGIFEHHVVRSGCRRLNCKTSSLSKYNAILERLMATHRMEERLDEIIEAVVNDRPTPAQQAKMEALDKQFVELQKHAERKCRKIIKPELEFSSKVKLWHERMQAYKGLIRWKKGNCRNDSNIIRTALRREIPNPKEMTLQEMEEGVRYTKAKKRELRDTATGLRKTHLRECLLKAESSKDEEKAKSVKAVIEREGSKKMWYFINRSQKDTRSAAPHLVQRMVDGIVQESTTKEETEEFVFEENEYRFQLAADAPISKTRLLEQLGYLADTEVAQQIIEGTFEIPDEIDDATALVLEEIGRIGVQMTSGEITLTITPEEFQYFWKRIKEGTASSYSGIHYGHYKAAAHSDKISSFLSKKITLISKTGVPPERWSYGLTVLLEKIAGLALVNKLRAILLMEADFNFHNKLIFGSRMLNAARTEGLIPSEQYSDKQNTAEDGSFDKILQGDISRQKRLPMSIISADAANCYDRVHHTIMALVFLSLGVRTGAIKAMLQSIQLMKFFLRTGWGESTDCFGGDALRILHGLCQGNGAAPAAWLALSSVLIVAYKSLGYGSKVMSPITKTWLNIMGVIYVDDTDLYIMDECVKSSIDIWEDSQGALTAWGKLLIATGGMLKPEKCFYYFVDYEWQDDGSWVYSDMVDWELLVPQSDGSETPIEQLPVDESKKTLGIWTNPAGDCTKQLEIIRGKVEKWTDRLQAGKLPSKWAWVSYFHQLWSQLRYGLGCNSSAVEDLEAEEDEGGHLRKLYRRMLPYLGVNRNIKAGWRHLHSSFSGIGLRKLLTEVVIGRINLFLQHYDTPSTLGKKLTISLQCLQLEAGTNGCPLLTPYHPMGPLTTPSWVRSFWQGLDYYNVKMDIDYPVQPIPREEDDLLCNIFCCADPPSVELLSLNRCRIAWELLFLSDMTSANGKHIEHKFLSHPTSENPPRSSFSFSEERPSYQDWTVWAKFWEVFTLPGLVLRKGMGKWIHPSHREWEWFFDVDHDVVERKSSAGISYYHPSTGQRRTRSQQNYILTSTHNDGRLPIGKPCTVSQTGTNTLRLLSHGPVLKEGPTKPDNFFAFLKTWKGAWMWNNIVNEGVDLCWVVDALTSGTAIWVTDGSFNRPIAPLVSGAGWIMYCTTTKQKLYGSFFERSPKAGSYRGELLGLLAIHTLVAAIESFFKITIASGKICCDNMGALFKSKEYRRRIPTGAAEADIKRSLRNIKTTMITTFEYEWVESHQDRYKLWHQLTLVQQLNCLCDTLAKRAVADSLDPLSRPIGKQVLPRESASIFVGGVKQTTDVAKAVRFTIGHSDAEKFYTTPLGRRDARGNRAKTGGLGWSKEAFFAVDWRALDATLDSKPQMYKQWLAKQASGFCGTQTMVAHWDKTRDGKCPCCQRVETAHHLNLCGDPDRTRLFNEMADKLGEWLNDNYAHPELAYWIPRYIKLRGTHRLGTFHQLSPEMSRVAASQDLIPWKDFMEGKLSKEIFSLQRLSLACSPSRLSIVDWAKRLISQVLQISHAQWIFRNVSLHDNKTGYLRNEQRREVLAEVDRLSQLDPSQIPESSKYLLEIDFSSFKNENLVDQSYWLFAMRAAKKAGRRVAMQPSQTPISTARRRASRQNSRGPTVSTDTHNMASGVLSRRTQTINRQDTPRPPRQQYVVPGAAATLRGIELDWDVRLPPSRTRPHPSTSDLLRDDSRQRWPD